MLHLQLLCSFAYISLQTNEDVVEIVDPRNDGVCIRAPSLLFGGRFFLEMQPRGQPRLFKVNPPVAFLSEKGWYPP